MNTGNASSRIAVLDPTTSYMTIMQKVAFYVLLDCHDVPIEMCAYVQVDLYTLEPGRILPCT